MAFRCTIPSIVSVDKDEEFSPLQVLETDNHGKHSFHQVLQKHALTLQPLSLRDSSGPYYKMCNQACRHCHVDASPKRTEQMNWAVMERCLRSLSLNEIENLDITGGAPELIPILIRL